MLALEKLHQFLVKVRELSVMFSPWWARHSSDIQQQVGNQPKRLLHSRKTSASFRLSTSITPDASELGGMKSSKKKSKHKHLKSKRHSLELPDSVSEITKRNKSQLGIVPIEVESNRESSGKKKGSCRVINLKIPLPDDAAFLLSRHYYYNPCKDYPQLADSTKTQEDGSTSLSRKTAKRKVGLGGRGTESEEQQPTLKSVELVNFATEDQLVSDVYSQHQRTDRPRSTSVMTPSLSSTSKYSSILALNESSSPSTPPTHHSHSNSTCLRKSYPGAESPELNHNAQHLLHPSHRSIHDYIFRPVFRYSHRNSAPGVNTSCPLTACSCIDGCRLCLSNVHMVHPAPLTLDAFKHPSTASNNRSRRGSLDSCCRPGVGVSLPPLKAQGDEEFSSYSELHALGHSMTKYPPRAADRRTGKISLASASTKSAREPPAPSYPDALTNGPPGYHRRLSQMAVLVSETIRWERDRPKVKKNQKAHKGHYDT